MTGMLASVNGLEEALQILAYDIDIIDLKQPAEGALGALSTADVTMIVEAVAGRKTVSATVGDLPMQSERLCPAVQAMAATGVDYVKIGFFPGGDHNACIDDLSQFCDDYALIAVLFADCELDLSILHALKKAGFHGVMLDTMDKDKGSLTEILSFFQINQFLREAKQLDLLSGLAGSLKREDIASLLPLNADYLGFRGALCEQHNRIAHLNSQRVKALIDSFKECRVDFDGLMKKGNVTTPSDAECA